MVWCGLVGLVILANFGFFSKGITSVDRLFCLLLAVGEGGFKEIGFELSDEPINMLDRFPT